MSLKEEAYLQYHRTKSDKKVSQFVHLLEQDADDVEVLYRTAATETVGGGQTGILAWIQWEDEDFQCYLLGVLIYLLATCLGYRIFSLEMYVTWLQRITHMDQLSFWYVHCQRGFGVIYDNSPPQKIVGLCCLCVFEMFHPILSYWMCMLQLIMHMPVIEHTG